MNKLTSLQLSQGITDLIVGLETDLIANIAAYLAAGKIEEDTAKWKMKKLAELGKLTKQNAKTIAEYAGKTPELLELTLQRAANSAIQELAPGLKRMVQEGLIDRRATPSMSGNMLNSLKMLQKQAKKDLNLTNTTMKYKAKNAAMQVINRTAELANKQEYIDSLNKATGKVVTGIEARQSAMRECIGEMTQKGIPAFVDKNGRNWSPEAYTNMCIRSTVGSVAKETQFSLMDEYGLDLVEVSSHSGARPLCAKDQGKIFNRNGGGGYTTDLDGKRIKFYSWRSSSYGKPAGLLGINCGHQIYPFLPGISVQTYFPYDEKENAKQYEKICNQRALERKVRASKRECTSLDTLCDKEGFDKAAYKLKQQEQQLKSYCEKNGLTYKPDRTATPGYGRSQAAKTTASYKAAVKAEQEQIKLIDVDKFDNTVIIDKYKSSKKFKLSEEISPDLAKQSGIKIIKSETISETVNGKVTDAANKVIEDIKGLKGKILSFSYGDAGEGALASCNFNALTAQNSIVLDEAIFSNSDALSKALSNDYVTGLSYETDNIESLIAHEIGHAAHNVLALKKCGFKYGEPLTILQAEIFKEEREKIIEKVYEIAFSDETVDEIFDACRKQLGKMAENPSELISQSFGNYYYGTTKSPIATKIVKYFKKELKSDE